MVWDISMVLIYMVFCLKVSITLHSLIPCQIFSLFRRESSVLQALASQSVYVQSIILAITYVSCLCVAFQTCHLSPCSCHSCPSFYHFFVLMQSCSTAASHLQVSVITDWSKLSNEKFNSQLCTIHIVKELEKCMNTESMHTHISLSPRSV